MKNGTRQTMSTGTNKLYCDIVLSTLRYSYADVLSLPYLASQHANICPLVLNPKDMLQVLDDFILKKIQTTNMTLIVAVQDHKKAPGSLTAVELP